VSAKLCAQLQTDSPACAPVRGRRACLPHHADDHLRSVHRPQRVSSEKLDSRHSFYLPDVPKAERAGSRLGGTSPSRWRRVLERSALCLDIGDLPLQFVEGSTEIVHASPSGRIPQAGNLYELLGCVMSTQRPLPSLQVVVDYTRVSAVQVAGRAGDGRASEPQYPGVSTSWPLCRGGQVELNGFWVSG
jgi:hypothetical protein